MPKYMTIGIELSDEVDYPTINFGSELLTGRIVSASIDDVFEQLDAAEEKLDQVSDIALDALASHELEHDCLVAIEKIKKLINKHDAEED